MKQGYKQTEIGIIPNDWKITSLQECVKQNLSYGVNAPAVSYDSHLPTYIRITDITADGQYDSSNKVSVLLDSYEKYVVEENDILLARTGASTGKSYIYNEKDGSLVFAGFLIRARVNPKVANAKYIFAQLHTDRYWKWVDSTSQRSGQPGINGKEYGEFLFPYPQKAEQTAIAAALSDTDALIESLEKLIAKKQAVKQGAMQELLTGKRRLKGFSGEWNYRKIKEIAPLQRGFDLPQSNLRQGTIPVVFSNGINAYHNKAMAKGPGVITGRSGTIGKIHYIMEDYWPHNTALWVTDFCGNNPLFIYYLFHLVDWEKYMSGSGVPTLNRNDVHEKIMFIPSDIHEQQAIAQILTDMDNEISALQKKLDKVRRIKQGMMAELLTGRIRLKEV